MKKVKLAVIGCGDIAKDMMTVCKVTTGVKVVDFCDIDKQKAQEQAKRFNINRTYKDYRAMLKETDANSVYIALPHYLHYPVIKDSLEASKHILCEKPITIQVDRAKEIVRLAEERDRVLAINYQYRYDKNCYRLVKAVRNGVLGEIYHIRCLVPWGRDERYFENSPWHASMEKAGGGTLLTQGSHLLDIILWMFQCGIKNVEGECKNIKFQDIETEDYCSLLLELENDIPVHFTSTMALPEELDVVLEVFGTKGYCKYIKRKNSKVFFTGVKPPKYRYGKPAVHAIQKGLRDFRDAILKDGTHLCPGEEAIRVLEAVNKIYEKTRNNKNEGI